MGKILALSLPELAGGFRLAGLDTVSVRSDEETYRALIQTTHDRSYEIIVLPQEHLTNLDERKRKEIDHLTEQVVVPIPMTNLENQPSPKGFVSELVRRAIGFQVKV
ncbi:MAG: hypothetical protein HY587_01315 [Candidatus Omnitrophica bacterium]|nr:hypothetical protein [Candidatus Omnitrophota bacterium]